MTGSLPSILFGAVIGACIGSYLTCVLWRIPRRIPITGRSVCPACGVQLKASWNIPVLGWLLLGGRSRCCRQQIPARYLLIETVGALAGAAITAVGGLIAICVTLAAVIVSTAAVSEATARSEK